MRETGFPADFGKYTAKRMLGAGFFLSVFGICLVFFLDVDIGAKDVLLGRYEAQSHEAGINYIQYILMYGTNYPLFLIFATLGYAVSIPVDWQAGIVPYVIKHMGIQKYARIQVGTAAFSGGLSAICGFGLFLIWMQSKMPLLPKDGQIRSTDYLQVMPYHKDLTLERAWMFLMILMVIFFLAGVTFTALTAGVSLYLGNRYLVFVFPYLLMRGYIELAKIFRIPSDVRLDRWFTAMAQPFPIPVCLGILAVFSLCVCLVSVRLFSGVLKWRLEHG